MVIKRILTSVLFVFTMGSVLAQSFNLEEVDAKLNEIREADQQIRVKSRDAFEKNLPNVQSIVSEMYAIDSVNQKYVSMLLDEHG